MSYIEWKRCLSDPKELLRLIALIFCVCVASYQLSRCFVKILHPPVYTHNTFEFNDTIRYPAITICRNPPFRLDVLKEYGVSMPSTNGLENFNYTRSSLDKFFAESTYSLKDTIPLFAFMQNTSNLDILEYYSYTNGRCFRLMPHEEMFRWDGRLGYSLVFSHSEKYRKYDSMRNSLSGFVINLHDRREAVTIIPPIAEIHTNNHQLPADVGKLNSFVDQVYVESGEDVKVNLRPQVYTHLSTGDNGLCNSDPNYSKSKCIEECVHKNLIEAVKCTVPWIPTRSRLPPCKDHADTVQLIQYLFDAKGQGFGRDCYCMDSCSVTIYSPLISSRKDIVKSDTASGYGFLYISMTNNLVMSMVELPGYDWNMFLADLGGSLGFLLGLSVLGLIEVFEAMFKTIAVKATSKMNLVRETLSSTGTTSNLNIYANATKELPSYDDAAGDCKNNVIKENADKVNPSKEIVHIKANF